MNVTRSIELLDLLYDVSVAHGGSGGEKFSTCWRQCHATLKMAPPKHVPKALKKWVELWTGVKKMLPKQYNQLFSQNYVKGLSRNFNSKQDWQTAYLGFHGKGRFLCRL